MAAGWSFIPSLAINRLLSPFPLHWLHLNRDGFYPKPFSSLDEAITFSSDPLSFFFLCESRGRERIMVTRGKEQQIRLHGRWEEKEPDTWHDMPVKNHVVLFLSRKREREWTCETTAGETSAVVKYHKQQETWHKCCYTCLPLPFIIIKHMQSLRFFLLECLMNLHQTERGKNNCPFQWFTHNYISGRQRCLFPAPDHDVSANEEEKRH